MKAFFKRLVGGGNPRLRVIDEKIIPALNRIEFPRYSYQVEEFWELPKLNAFLTEKESDVVSVTPIQYQTQSVGDDLRTETGYSVVYRVKVDEPKSSRYQTLDELVRNEVTDYYEGERAEELVRCLLIELKNHLNHS
jgi:hypothetical protein